MPDVVSLREHVEARIDALDRHLAAELANGKEAVAVALVATDKRLDLLNEFRRQVSDEAARYPQREVVDQQFTEMARRLGAVEHMVATLHGRAIAFGAVGAIIGAAVALAGGLVL